MDNAGGVRHGEPLGNLLRQVDRAAMRHRPCPQLVAQRPALHPLHGEVRRVALSADIVDRQDVRVVERRCGTRFLLEALEAVRRREARREDLDRDRALQARVVRAVDLTHPALANLLEDAIRPEVLAALHGGPRLCHGRVSPAFARPSGEAPAGKPSTRQQHGLRSRASDGSQKSHACNPLRLPCDTHSTGSTVRHTSNATFNLDLKPIESMLLPEPPDEGSSAHGNVPVQRRGVRLDWTMRFIKAVEAEIQAMWERYDNHSRAYEHLNWAGDIPEPTSPDVPRDQLVTALFVVDHVVRPLTAREQGGPVRENSTGRRRATDDVPFPLLARCAGARSFRHRGSTLLSAKPDTQLPGDTLIWLDLLVYNQHVPQSIAADMEGIIGSIGSLISSFRPNSVLSRLWCLWELLCANNAGARIHVVETAVSRSYFGQARESFDSDFTSVSAAETTHEADRTQILEAMVHAFGSVEAADAFVRRTVLEKLTQARDAPWRKRDRLTSDRAHFVNSIRSISIVAGDVLRKGT